ncbi:MAG: hypothetical protein ACREM2_01670 [Vulcanimicrobiaceae bacterium]
MYARTTLSWLFSCGLLFAGLDACSGGGGGGSTPVPVGSITPGGHGGGSSSDPSPTPGATTGQISYNLSQACVDHKLLANSGLPKSAAAPHGEGEFDLDGLDRSFWGGVKTRTTLVAGQSSPVSWGPGFYQSWGRFQYDTYFGDSSDGSGYDPFSVTVDPTSGVQALSIEAMLMPPSMKDNPHYASGYTATKLTANIVSPPVGGSVTLPVANPNGGTQMGWLTGIGRGPNPPAGGSPEDDPQRVVFIGTVTAGGCTVNESTGACTGGSSNVTISNVTYDEGGPGVTIPSGTDVQDWDFPAYYSGALDTNIDQEYGFFVARIRLPQPAPALSPAWWMLETGGTGTNGGQLLRSEWDIEEMFANDYGYADLNAGNILWNSGNPGWYSYGCGLSCSSTNNQFASGATGAYPWPSTETTNYNAGYHDYGVLISPPTSGTPPFPTNYSGSYGVYVENNNPYGGTTYYLDGNPIAGHVGAPDLTQGSPDKELMAMFQVAASGTFLDGNGQGPSDPFPEYYWLQWMRVYVPTSGSC